MFGWDPFAVDWRDVSTPTPPVTTTEIPGGHRIKEQDSDHLRRKRRKEDEYEPVKTRELTDDELQALDEGFRERAPQAPVIPNAVPVYLAPPAPLGSGRDYIKRDGGSVPVLAQPSIAAALFDETATQGQREAAFTFFDRLETKLDQQAKRRTIEARQRHHESIRYAQEVAHRQYQAWQVEQARLAQDEEDTMLAILHLIDELDL